MKKSSMKKASMEKRVATRRGAHRQEVMNFKWECRCSSHWIVGTHVTQLVVSAGLAVEGRNVSSISVIFKCFLGFFLVPILELYQATL